MKIACTALAAIAGTLAFTGSAAAFDRATVNNSTENTQPAAGFVRTVDFDYERFQQNATEYQSNAVLPIAIGDCGNCAGSIVDNLYAPLAGDFEPNTNLANPFFTDNGLIDADGDYNDIINDWLFSDPPLATTEIPTLTNAGDTICGLWDSYFNLGGAGRRGFESFFISEATIAANNNPGESLMTINVRTPYWFNVFIVPANDVDGDSPAGWWVMGSQNPFDDPADPTDDDDQIQFVEPAWNFGDCYNGVYELDLAGILGPGDQDYVVTIFTSFLIPDADQAADLNDYSFTMFPSGVCCINGTATENGLVDDCEAAGGVFWGIGSILSQDGGLDGGVVCELCDLDTGVVPEFYETESTFGTNDDPAAGSDFNNGCVGFDAVSNPNYNSTPFDATDFFGATLNESLLGQRWVGTTFTYFDSTSSVASDVDYYDFQATQDGTVEVAVETDTPVWVRVHALAADPTNPSNDPCTGIEVIGQEFAGFDGECTTIVKANVDANQWYAISVRPLAATGAIDAPEFQAATLNPQQYVSSQFDFPELNSGSIGNRYSFVANIVTEEAGACCFIDGADDLFEDDCLAQNGFFNGPGTTIADGICCPDAWVVGGILEGEDETCVVDPLPDTVDDTFNGGCDASDVFSNAIALANGDVVNGETATYAIDGGGTGRDLDYYSFTHAGGDITVDFAAQFEGVLILVGLANSSCADGTLTFGDNSVDISPDSDCSDTSQVVNIPAGDYAFLVTTEFGDASTDCNVELSEFSRYSLGWSAAPVVTCADGCTDIDRLGATDIEDLLLVLRDFGLAVDADGNGLSGFQTDVDCTGAVDVEDLLAVLREFGNAAQGVCN